MTRWGFDSDSPNRPFSLEKGGSEIRSTVKLRRSREVSKDNDENEREMIQVGPNDETLMLVERVRLLIIFMIKNLLSQLTCVRTDLTPLTTKHLHDVSTKTQNDSKTKASPLSNTKTFLMPLHPDSTPRPVCLSAIRKKS